MTLSETMKQAIAKAEPANVIMTKIETVYQQYSDAKKADNALMRLGYYQAVSMLVDEEELSFVDDPKVRAEVSKNLLNNITHYTQQLGLVFTQLYS